MAKSKHRVRVLSGSLGGRVLSYPSAGRLRPSMTRLKSSVFDALHDTVRGSVFADLFAGAGAVGIEALSRGASYVHFVERDPDALECLRRNIESCGIGPEQHRVYAKDVLCFVGEGELAGIAPNVVFADPPYGYDGMPLLLELLGAIAYPESTLLIIEHDRNTQIEFDERLTRTRVKDYGQTRVSWFVAGGGRSP